MESGKVAAATELVSEMTLDEAKATMALIIERIRIAKAHEKYIAACEILRLRYMEGLKWDEVVNRSHYSLSHAHRLAKAFQSISKEGVDDGR